MQATSQSYLARIFFAVGVIACLFPVITPPLAMIIGYVICRLAGNPYSVRTASVSRLLLQVSVVCLGFGMNVFTAFAITAESFTLTATTICATLLLGVYLGKFLGVPKNATILIASGTAICGGSAIAAVAPILKARDEEIAVSLGSVFLLNAVALLLFPWLGAYLALSQADFGLWSAIAIHDTSSVIGAAQLFGAEALAIATTVKLARALWIVPLVLLVSYLTTSNLRSARPPLFIILFILAMIVNTAIPAMQPISAVLTGGAKIGITLTLFLIGANLSNTSLESVGRGVFVYASLLWCVVAVSTLLFVMR